MSAVAAISLALSGIGLVLSLAVGVRARRRVGTFGPPAAAAGSEREFELERRAALRGIQNCLLTLRATARSVLALGTATSVLALADGFGESLTRATARGLVCFAFGAVGAIGAAHFGRLAKLEQATLRADWNRAAARRSRDA